MKTRYGLVNFKCAQCGKRYGKRKTTQTGIVIKNGEPEPMIPDGHLLIKRTVHQYRSTPKSSHYIISWDRRSYIAPYKPFCSWKCGLVYARKAHAEKRVSE